MKRPKLLKVGCVFLFHSDEAPQEQRQDGRSHWVSITQLLGHYNNHGWSTYSPPNGNTPRNNGFNIAGLKLRESNGFHLSPLHFRPAIPVMGYVWGTVGWPAIKLHNKPLQSESLHKTHQDFMVHVRAPRIFVEKLLRWKLTTCFILFAMLALLAHRKLLVSWVLWVFSSPNGFGGKWVGFFFWGGGGWKMMNILLFVYRAAIFRYIYLACLSVCFRIRDLAFRIWMVVLGENLHFSGPSRLFDAVFFFLAK